MNYSAFLSTRLNYFHQVRAFTQAGRIITAPTSLNLNAATMKIAESRAERRYVRDKGAFEIMRHVLRVEPIVTVRWELPENAHCQIQVQLLHQAEDRVYMCVQSDTKAWYAIGRVAGPEDPFLFSGFFSSCRAHDRHGFGFALHIGPPMTIANHRPDLVSAPAAISIYGHWLRWACGRVWRSSGIYPVIPYVKPTATDESTMNSDELKRALIGCYVERPASHTSRKRKFRPAEGVTNDATVKHDNQIEFLADRVRYLRTACEESCSRLAEAAQHHGNTKVAIEQVENLVRMTLNPEKKAYCLLWLGILLEQVLDFEGASVCYGEAIAMEPTDKTTWYFLHNNRGYCLNQLGKYGEADWYCRAAIGIDGASFNAHKNLGVALAGQGQHAQAARCLIRSVKLNPADPRALKHLEDLIREHAEIFDSIPDIEILLEQCKNAVQKTIGGHTT